MVVPGYTYRAVITDVYDGDTVTADIDLGLSTWVHGEKLRLYRINAPEVRGAERTVGLESRDWLREKVLGKTVIIQTIKDRKGKYGRYLAEIWLNQQNMNDLIVAAGHAEYKDY
ncbi:MAG: thermonuclease family protein [Candidatus Thiodiazotropha taylori]|nr:thermonuclease family protein [Candidatus Thiodiazotropha taylori]